MKIIVNGKTDVLTVTPGTSLGQLLQQIRAFLAKYNQLASHILLDGELLSEEKEFHLSETLVTEFKKLEVTTSPILKHILEILSSFVKLIDKFKDTSTSIGLLLLQGKKTKALTKLQEFIEKLTVFSDGLLYSATALKTIKPGSYTPQEKDLQKFKELLSRLYECLAAEDEVEFADILNFELPDNLEKFRTIINKTLNSLLSKSNEEKKPSCNN